ncbi:MAG: transketolase C-terminal domain-containing protein [Promethearchaeota archaeon]
MSNINIEKNRFLPEGKHLLMGNVAVSEGAIAAGLRFFGGYPITPSTEVIEHLAKRLPQVKGVCMQMEDELASINAVIGASLVGVKAMTATSGPGVSLMAETVSMAANLEVPFVLYDVQRNGPGTGYVTDMHHNDIGFVRFCGNGEFQVIALAPMNCQELFDLTITAFNYAEEYRCPVFILSDAYLGHLHEVVNIPSAEIIKERIIERKLPEEPSDNFYSYRDRVSNEYIIPPMPIMGTEYCPGMWLHQPHGPAGLPTPKPIEFIQTIMEKINSNKDKICLYDEYLLDDAEIVIVAYGLPVRSSYRAVDLARKEGIKVGIFRLITIWPFPDDQIKKAVENAKAVIVPEINYTGVIAEQVERFTKLDIPVIRIPKVCDFHHPDEILKAIKEANK